MRLFYVIRSAPLILALLLLLFKGERLKRGRLKLVEREYQTMYAKLFQQ
jgi:hypothetical protein